MILEWVAHGCASSGQKRTLMTSTSTPLTQLWRSAATAPELAGLLVPPARALPVPPATHREAWDLDSGALHAPTVDELLTRAAQERGTPWPQPRASQWAAFVRTGDRVGYEHEIFSRSQRLSRAVLALAVTGEPEWLDEVADGVMLLCEQSSWCWPAHDDAHSRRGWLLPDLAEPYLDLGAGEVAAQLAWIDHLVGPWLSESMPGARERIRHEVRQRVLEPYWRRRDWHWLALDRPAHNWNPWICGNVMLAALVLIDDPEDVHLRAQTVARTIEDVDRFVATIPLDGAIDEGTSYWWEGACRLLEMLEVLRHATGGRLDATELPALRETVAFPHRMHLGQGWYVNVADGTAQLGAGRPWDLPHRWARLLGDDQAQRHAAAQGRREGPLASEATGLGRLVKAVTDQEWIAAAGQEPATPSGRTWLPSVEVLLLHHRWGERRLSLMAKAGHNGENHNHNDVGEVIVAVDGVPVLVDPGRPTYTRETFGPHRYELWPMQSQWHSVPLIRGTGQSAGREFASAGVAADETGLAQDLAGAYDRRDLRHWHRRAELDANGVTIVDTWDLAALEGSAGPTRLHWILAGRVQLEGPGRAVVEAVEGGGAVELIWDPALSAHVETQELEDPYLTEPWGERLTRLAIDLDVGTGPEQGSTRLQVRTLR